MELRCNRQALYETAEELHNLSTGILSIKQSMDTICLNDAFSGYEWDIMTCREMLRKLSEDLIEELQGMLALQICLRDSADVYGETERNIIALYNGLNYSQKILTQAYIENTKGLIYFAPGYGIIEEKEKWYQSNEFKLLLSLGINIALGIANVYLGGTLTPLLKASLVASVGSGVIEGTASNLTGGEFYDGFSDGGIRGTVGTIALGGMQMELASVAYGSARTAIATKAFFGAIGTDVLYSTDSFYHGQEPALSGHLVALGTGGIIEGLATAYLHDYKLIPNSKTGTITEYAGYVNSGDAVSSEFKYEHNPSANPKVLQDAIEDSCAVYGYKPSKDGSLKAFADDDWSNGELVNSYKENRIKYHQENDVNREIAETMRANGKSDSEIAQALVERRNNNRLNSYIDEDGNIIDVQKYNQALEHCKTYEQLRAGTSIKPGKTDIEIIESSTRGNPGFDACTGLYDLYYNTYK